MRMRRKRYLEQRIDNVQTVLIVQEGYNFYQQAEDTRYNILNMQEIFNNSNAVHLEIGCGKGGFVTEMAKKYPDINFLAVEKLSNVIVEACEKIVKQNIQNVRLMNCGAENLPYYLPQSSIDTIYLNFSCPYPKKTYANRRLTNVRFLDRYKKFLKPDGIIQLKTDNIDFFNYSIEQLIDNNFTVYDITNDLHNSQYNADNILTEYEQKFMQQNIPINQFKAKLNL